jgi:hypothetical protein
LGYTRRFHFWCGDSLDAEHTYDGLILSLEYFGDVSEEVLVDNQNSTVLEHPASGAHFNQRFSDWLGTMGSRHTPADPTEREPKARMNAWWATPRAASLCAIATLRVGGISIPSSGNGLPGQIAFVISGLFLAMGTGIDLYRVVIY